MSQNIYLQHYEKALEVLSVPEFLEQELALHDYKREGFRIQDPHWDYYIDGIVSGINDIPSYGYYSYVLTDEFKNSNINWKTITSNSRYSIVKFKHVAMFLLAALKEKIVKARKEQESYLSKKKPKEKIVIPLSFEDKEWLLVKFHDNYADEFDISGFKVFHTQEWEEWQAGVPDKSFETYFGTNEATSYFSRENFLSNFKVIPITIEQAKTIFQLFSSKNHKHLDWNGRYHNKVIESVIAEYGMFPSHVGENDDDVDDEEDNE